MEGKVQGRTEKSYSTNLEQNIKKLSEEHLEEILEFVLEEIQLRTKQFISVSYEREEGLRRMDETIYFLQSVAIMCLIAGVPFLWFGFSN